MSERLDCIVIGGGAIGIAIARCLALAGREVVVLEAESAIATHTSSRNSEVIHAGIYYPQDSLKAKLCVAGRELLYDYCRDRHVPYRKTGKIIVAVNRNDADALGNIAARATANGVTDLQWLSRQDVQKLEPEVEAASGLLSPSTGILDSHSFMLALQGELESANGSIVCHSKVGRIRILDDGFEIQVGDDSGYTVSCNYLVNAAGLWAQEVAGQMVGFPKERIPTLHMAKAHYFAYQASSPFRRLVYPLPGDGGLGIHVTLDMNGFARFGPDVTWVTEINYDFDDGRKPDFVAAIRQFFPALDANRLMPAYTGIRPKLSGPADPAADFVIQGFADHGVKGLINLFGIESPGLTASLAIGGVVSRELFRGG